MAVCLSLKRRSLERLPCRRHRAGDHVGDLAGDRQQAAAVVAQVENEIRDVLNGQLRERVDELLLGRREVIVELYVADVAGWRADRADVLHRVDRHVRGRQRHGSLRARLRIAQHERVILARLIRIEPGNERIDRGLRVGVDDVDAIDEQHFLAALQVGCGRRRRRVRMRIGHDDPPRRRAGNDGPHGAVTRFRARLHEREPVRRPVGEVEAIFGAAGRRRRVRLQKIEVLRRRMQSPGSRSMISLYQR